MSSYKKHKWIKMWYFGSALYQCDLFLNPTGQRGFEIQFLKQQHKRRSTCEDNSFVPVATHYRFYFNSRDFEFIN